jgi:CBS domain containing-hemolysin-like protein
MTPRPVVFAVAENMTAQEFFNNHSDKPFSRIPIFEGNSDNITGYVLKTDVLIAQAKDEFEKKLREFRRNLMVLPESLTVSDVYDALIRAKSHIGLVVDEYGTMQGLVTQEDVMETLMGLQITDELDTVEDMQTLAHKRWRERMEAIDINADSVEKTGGKRD